MGTFNFYLIFLLIYRNLDFVHGRVAPQFFVCDSSAALSIYDARPSLLQRFSALCWAFQSFLLVSLDSWM